MAVKADISTETVISAVHTLRKRNNRPPSVREIVEYLEAPVEDVSRHLRTLEAKRIFCRTNRRGENVVLHWSECH